VGKCIMCGRKTQKVLHSKAIVKIHICSEECLKEYYKPLKGYKPKIQKRLVEDDGWID
jgi:hypothetical protein